MQPWKVVVLVLVALLASASLAGAAAGGEGEPAGNTQKVRGVVVLLAFVAYPRHRTPLCASLALADALLPPLARWSCVSLLSQLREEAQGEDRVCSAGDKCDGCSSHGETEWSCPAAVRAATRAAARAGVFACVPV